MTLGVASRQRELFASTVGWYGFSSTTSRRLVNAHGQIQRIRTPITLAADSNIECRASQGVFEIDYKFVIAAAVKPQFEEP
jgi:hypothetical protein